MRTDGPTDSKTLDGIGWALGRLLRIAGTAQCVECAPAGVTIRNAGARAGVEVGATPSTESAAVWSTKGCQGQFKQEGIAHKRAQVQLVALQGIGVLVEVGLRVPVTGVTGMTLATGVTGVTGVTLSTGMTGMTGMIGMT